ncbi:MAG: peptidase U32 family protein [bacterium]
MVELLAPAGSFAALTAAINAGADSVYLGIGELNMRSASAINFTPENLLKAVKQAHVANVKVYVTVNTLIYDAEMPELKKILKAVKKSGADAIIASDQAVIMQARDLNIPIHISTQLSVSNYQTVKFYAQFAERIVLARELSLEQIKEICQQIKKEKLQGATGRLMEIEVFAHGALCVAVSGRCAMSLYFYNKSANRGKCSQICRRQFKVTDLSTNKELVLDNNFLMSSADLSTIGFLPQLLATGIKVLKIEGRGRPPEYIDTVIRTYQEAISSINEDTYSEAKVKIWQKKLETVFNRGFTSNFYQGKEIAEWSGIHGSKATEIKVFLGNVEKYYPKSAVIHAKIKAKEIIKSGDKVMILGPKTGVLKFLLPEMLVNDVQSDSAKQGDDITFKFAKTVKAKDELYKIVKNNSTVSKGKEFFISKEK